MLKNNIKISNIPAILWGEKSEKLFIAIHGDESHKEDTVIELLANEAIPKGYQILSFDLPEHGDRKDEGIPCKAQYCVSDLNEVLKYAKESWNDLSLFACSIGAYFSLTAYKNEFFQKALFLSPVVNMERIIKNMMMWFEVTPEKLQKENIIETPINKKLYWDYFCFVMDNPVEVWKSDTSILYGEKDNLCEIKIIKEFVDTFHCDLKIVQDGEHYFHTKEQLDIFVNWLKENIK